MFWADEVVQNIEKQFLDRKSFIVRDEKTPSGRVHVGSLRGVVIHGIVAQALAEKGFDVKYYFEFNDTDPMDGMPVYLNKEAYTPYMGFPLRMIPPPNEKGEPDQAAFNKDPKNNFATFYAKEFEGVIRKLGFTPIFYYNSELYEGGKYDKWIDIVLERSAEIREVYKKISGSEKGEEWNPVQIICEKCGKVGTTTVVGSEGMSGKKIVEYKCEPNKVKWATGCGHQGKVSPYFGRGKLPWKVEWAVKWQIWPVDVEGAGKDHGTVGGSRDVAAGIVADVLKGSVPVDVPYEFFTFGGAKMSSSKAVGSFAKDVSDSLPQVLLRFLMVRNRPEKHIDFDPSGGTLPRLFDFYDEAAEVRFGHLESDVREDISRAFHFAQLNTDDERDFFRLRFSRVAFLIQMPQLDYLHEVEKIKGSTLTNEEIEDANNRAEYARSWLRDFASENDKFEVKKALPDLARTLSEDQKVFLKNIASLLESRDWQGEELHAAIHELRKDSVLEAKTAFQAIYIALLGKNSGPQVGWFLESLPKEFTNTRFKEVADLPEYIKKETPDLVTEYVIINKEVREKFPGIKLGFNVLKGVSIKKSDDALSELQKKLWAGLNFEELKKSSPRLEAFREIYKGFGVNPSKNRPSPVALITRLANRKELPNVNLAVDIYNAIAVKHQLAIGLFDLDKIKLPIELRFALGGEKFQGLGTEEPVPIMPGELCYFDATGIVMARDFNYYDSELTKVDENTKNILLNVDGNEACTKEEVKECLDELEKLLKEYCGGSTQMQVIADAAQFLNGEYKAR